MLSTLAHSRKIVHVSGASLGPLKTNCYLLRHNYDKILIIDPGDKIDGFIQFLKQVKPHINELDIYLTHGHWNHIAGVPRLCKTFPKARIFASKKDIQLFTSEKYNLSDKTDHPFSLKKYLSKFVFVKDGDILPYHLPEKYSELGEDKLSVLETPGHTPGSTVLKVENQTQKIIFSGDTLLEGTIGKTDMGLGDYKTIMKSIMEKLYPLPDNFRVFPGHGVPTMMHFEKKGNPLILDELRKRKK